MTSWSQSFRVSPSVRAVGNGQVVVQSRLLRVGDSPIELDYVMRRGPSGWQVVEVLTDGSISRAPCSARIFANYWPAAAWRR